MRVPERAPNWVAWKWKLGKSGEKKTTPPTREPEEEEDGARRPRSVADFLRFPSSISVVFVLFRFCYVFFCVDGSRFEIPRPGVSFFQRKPIRRRRRRRRHDSPTLTRDPDRKSRISVDMVVVDDVVDNLMRHPPPPPPPPSLSLSPTSCFGNGVVQNQKSCCCCCCCALPACATDDDTVDPATVTSPSRPSRRGDVATSADQSPSRRLLHQRPSPRDDLVDVVAVVVLGSKLQKIAKPV